MIHSQPKLKIPLQLSIIKVHRTLPHKDVHILILHKVLRLLVLAKKLQLNRRKKPILTHLKSMMFGHIIDHSLRCKLIFDAFVHLALVDKDESDHHEDDHESERDAQVGAVFIDVTSAV